MLYNELFRRGFPSPLLKCLDKKQAEYLMIKLHHEICGLHSEAHCMTARALRFDYYWPTMKKDVKIFIQKCQECRNFGPIHLILHEELYSIITSCPFNT